MAFISLQDRFRLLPITSDDVHRRSKGCITKSSIASDMFLSGGTLRAEKGGFYCEAIFGPWDARDPEAFAHIELGSTISHPWLPVKLEALPVLPAAYRSPKQTRRGFSSDDITWHYSNLYAMAQRFQRLSVLSAPEDVMLDAQAGLERALGALMNNEFVTDPFVWVGQERISSLASALGTSDPAYLEALLFSLGLRLEPAEG